MDSILKSPYRSYIRQHIRPFSFGLLALLATNSLDVLTPLLVGRVMDQMINWKNFSEIVSVVGILFLVALGLGLCRFLWRYFWGQFHHSVAEDLRNRLFAKMTELGPTTISKWTTGDLMSLINHDVNSFRMAIGPGVLVLVDSLLILVFVPVLMWRISPDWTWRCLILMPMVPFLVRWILRKTHAAYQEQQKLFSEMSGSAQELVSGIRVIKSYAQEENQTRLFNIHSEKFRLACDRVARVDAAVGPVLEISAACGCVILLLIGSRPVVQGQISLGQFFAFYQYVQKMIWPMEGLGVSLSQFQMGRASFERIRRLMSEPQEAPDVGRHVLTDWQGLEVRHLSFRYPGQNRWALKDINFSLKQGEVLGIVGTTSSGKTTLAELLCRFFCAPPGSIYVNGIPLEDIQKKSLRRWVTMVPQDNFLFSQTLHENISYGTEGASSQEIQRVAELVHLDHEVVQWPEGYDTMIGERGVNLSGGQKQRVTLARTMLRSSSLWILDDALSAVDAKTGRQILKNLQQVLRKENNQNSLIMISHKLDLVSWADRILVLHQGEVEAYGSHQELLQQSATYRQLNDLQTQGALA